MKRRPLFKVETEDLQDFPVYRKLSPGRSLVFIHINKTGGTSLRSAFNFPEEDRWRGHFRKHYRYTDLVSCLPAEILEQSVIAAFVRNPWDRIISLYHYRKQLAASNGYQKNPEKIFSSFSTWFYHQLEIGKFRSRNLSPQLDWICDEQGKEKADFIGKFETLEEDVYRLGKMLEIDSLSIPHLNKSNRRQDYRSFYTPALKEAVRDLYHVDIERFEYQF
jgi:hypothetical protein